ERLPDAVVDVAAAERLRRRGENRQFVNLRGKRAFEAGNIGHQRGIARPRPPDNRCEHVRGVAHLGDPLRADERRRFDDRVSGLAQPIDERNLVGRGNRRRLVLESIARANFDDGRSGWKGHSNSTSGTSGCTSSPGRQLTATIRPSPGAITGNSIFIASRTTSTVPFLTRSPGAILIATTVAGMGAVSDPCTCEDVRRASPAPIS